MAGMTLIMKLDSGYDEDVVEIENYFCFPFG